MKQYLNSEQTAKLVELGFEKPNGLEFLVREQDNPDNAQIVQRMSYSIGELIKILPMFLDEEYGYTLSIYNDITKWIVAYDNGDECSTIYAITKEELVDALFDMILKLKEEGEI